MLGVTMADDDYVFGSETTKRIVDYVRGRERRALNGVQPWRTNKYMPGGKSVIKWGLSPPIYDPANFRGLRIENTPNENIGYNDPNGFYTGEHSISVSSFPLGVVADTWYPLQKIDQYNYRLMVEDIWMMGCFGTLSDYDPDATSPSTGKLTIDDGDVEDLVVEAVETMYSVPAVNNAKTYCLRSSNLGPNTALVFIVAQGCEPDGE
jgi:hypothetical protein